MFRLIRLLIYAAGIYALFLIAFPEWNGEVYHVATLAIIGGAAVGLFILTSAIQITSTAMKIAIELAFAAGVAVWLAYTMPQKSGKTPWEQWAEGHRPNQSEARQGLSRLGADPQSPAAAFVIGLFPKG
jgi:hypothetical protein